MDRRRLLILAAVLPSLALAAQGGPVYTAIPTYPSAGGACTTGRVQVENASGKQWCCVAAHWQTCGGVPGMTDPAVVTTLLGPMYLSTTATGQRFVGTDILGCADVRAFGARGNGVADDTAAIQAAINSGPATGGPVCLPAGTFRVTSTLTLRNNTSVYGAGKTTFPTPATGGTIIDGTAITSSVSIIDGSTGANQVGIRLQGFTVRGYQSTGIYDDPRTTCISLSGAFPTLRDVSTAGCRVGVLFTGAVNGRMENCKLDWTYYQSLYVYQSDSITLTSNVFANAGQLGSPAAAYSANVTSSAHIFFTDNIFDESFGTGATSLGISGAGATDIFVRGGLVYSSHLGYGVWMGTGANAPTNVTLQDLRVKPFVPGNAPVNSIVIRGSGHNLINVVTETGAGGDWVEAVATSSTWLNFNGKTKLPALPASYPGTGSKQLWYDPAAATTNVVRFAP